MSKRFLHVGKRSCFVYNVRIFAHNLTADLLDREGIVKAINDSGLLSYDVRSTRISNYLTSIYSLARLLRQSGKYPEATDDVLEGSWERLESITEQEAQTILDC